MNRIILVFTSALIVSCAGTAGSISGTVRGSDGTAVTPGVVVVTYVGTGVADQRRPTNLITAQIGSDGSFQTASLDLGQYQLCVEAPLTTWLSSCEWGNTGTAVSLTGDQPSTALSIVLTKGASISVRVIDPLGLLSANEGKTAGAHLLVGVELPSMIFRIATIISQDVTGRTYRVVVPFDRSARISVASAFFQLSGSNGNALPKFGNVFPVLVASGQQPPTLTFNLTSPAHP